MQSNTSPQAKKRYANNKAEHIGSFLRALKLKKARYDFADRVIYQETLRQVEDQEILNLIDIQFENECHVMTDGDFRRGSWDLDFFEELIGIKRIKTRQGTQFHDAITKAHDISIMDKIAFPEDHPCLAHYRFLHQAVDGVATAKYCVPSPMMLLSPKLRKNLPYQNNMTDYFADIISTYKAMLLALYGQGCRYIQFNDMFLAYLCDENSRQQEAQKGVDPEQLAEHAVYLLNSILENKPEDLIIALHIQRGNFLSSWLYQGGYASVADTVLAKLNNIDRFFLEFDSARCGDFTPLKAFQNSDAEVFLGLISSKNEWLETKDEIKAKILAATAYLPLAQLGLSLQSGFASMEEGNKISYDTQWKKLQLLNQVAKEVWA
jgi:5-methyltetrahydropteroyltriglutamate--homocysteine methyltransferase